MSLSRSWPDVLVPQGSPWAGVPQPDDELLEGRPGCRRRYGEVELDVHLWQTHGVNIQAPGLGAVAGYR